MAAINVTRGRKYILCTEEVVYTCTCRPAWGGVGGYVGAFVVVLGVEGRFWAGAGLQVARSRGTRHQLRLCGPTDTF